jgi:hypothetical protein
VAAAEDGDLHGEPGRAVSPGEATPPGTFPLAKRRGRV